MKAAAWLLAVAAVSAGPAVAEEPDAVWSPVESPTTDDLHIVRFWPDGTGWAFGENGATLRYDGTSWKQIPGPDPEAILHFAALAGPDEAWAAESGNNRLYHYARGQWSTVHLGAEMQTGGLDFLGPELGYAVGLFGVAYRYSNGRWERIQAPALASDRESHLTGVVILAPDDVWFGSSGDFVVHFDGREWRRLRPRGSEARGWFATRFGDTVALGGVPTLVRRGEAWEVIAPRTLFSVATGAGDTWGVAEGTSLVRVAPGEAVPAAPGRWIAAVAMGPHGSWAVGLHGTILRLERRRLPAFVDRTFEAGVGALAPSRAAALADLDGDGHPDLVLDSPFGRNSFLRNDGAGRFRVQPLVGLDASALSGGDAVAADLDGDGRVDLLVRPPGRPGQRPLRFYRNLGGWRFVDSSPAAAPLPAEDASDLGAVAVADLDGDGSLDAYEARFLNTPAGRPIPNVLWRNDGLGRFTQARLSHRDGGAALAWARGALLSDLDGDGRADVLSVNMWGQGNMLFLQGAGGALVDATAASGLQGAIQENLVALSGDVDGDGALDVLMLSMTRYGPSRLFRNDGHGHFRDWTSASGLDLALTDQAGAAPADFADLDNDGDLDLVVCSGVPSSPSWREAKSATARVLLNDGHGRFSDVTAAAGASISAVGVVADDLDGDGRVDLYLVRDGEANRLLSNATRGGEWLKVRLEGPPPNRAGLGAQVRVRGPDGALLGVRETSWRHPVAHFGLGPTSTVSVEARFPSGRIERVDGVRAGQTLTIQEGSWPARVAREASFFARHRLAWADRARELLKLAAALLLLVATRRAAAPLGARHVAASGWWLVPLVLLQLVLAVACAPLASQSAVADALPLASVLAGCAGLLLGSRFATRRAESRFVGPYELLGTLGEGGMGIVYRARDTSSPGRPVVALKVLRPERTVDPASLRRLVREAELGGRLSHPGIVSVLAGGECRVLDGRTWKKTAYIALELVDGVSLAELLAREALPLGRVLEIARDTCAALAMAHGLGVLHRDVKPENILLSKAGVVKLADFGIAATLHAATVTEVGKLTGTLAYLSPERAAGRKEDARSDLYSLGCVLYEAVCGRPPFTAGDAAALISALLTRAPPPPSEVRPGIPRALEELIHSLLAKEPGRRPASADAVASALEELIHDLAGELRPFHERRSTGAADGERPGKDPAPPEERRTLDLPGPPSPGKPPES